MGRQHLTVRIHIYSSSLCLLQQLFHILQVMPADQNPRVQADANINFGDFRVAVSGCIGPVEQSHYINAELAAFQHKPGQFISA
ncbi:hypothetical protein D3C74_419430 [compost metagenome]